MAISILERLALFLQSRPALTALIGTDNVHAVKLPERPTYPAVSFFRVNPIPLATLDDGPQVVEAATVQVTAWSTDVYEADSVAEQLRQELQGFRGSMSGLTVGSVIAEPGGGDIYDDEAQEPGVHGVRRDYTIWWKTT